jgi:hypothetical protein
VTIELRKAIEPKRHEPTFARQQDAIAYVQMVAKSIVGMKAPDKPIRWAQERARQDQKNGYRLVAKQKRTRQARLALKMQRQQNYAEALKRYQERIGREWPIVKPCASHSTPGERRGKNNRTKKESTL